MSMPVERKVDSLSTAIGRATGAELDDTVRELCHAVTGRLDGGLGPEHLHRLVAVLIGLPDSCEPDLRINTLNEAGFRLYQSCSPDGIQVAESVVGLARRTGRRRLLRKSLTIVAIWYADAGDVARALGCYAEALELADRIQEPEGVVSVYLNVGVALMYAEQYHDAVRSFEHAIGCTAALDPPAASMFRRSANSNLALCYLHLGEIERGLRAAEVSLKDMPDPTTGSELHSRVLRETYYARLLLEAGQVAAAGEHSRLARHYAARAGTARAEIMSDLSEGLFRIHAGQRDQGMAILESALPRARDMPVMLRDCLRTLARAHDLCGQTQEAIGYLEEAIEAARQWRCEAALQKMRHHFPALGPESFGNAAISIRLRTEEAALRGKVSREELFRTQMEMLDRLAVAAELRDDRTGEHCHRVGRLSALLARELGWDSRDVEAIERAARLHDIGKIGIEDDLILKRAPLTEQERDALRGHARIGAELLLTSDIPGIELAAAVALHHHDWWDGSRGEGAKGASIPIAARIVALAEVFDALTHSRVHRAAWSQRDALDELERRAGSQFDPALARAFGELVTRISRDGQVDEFLREMPEATDPRAGSGSREQAAPQPA
jgi:putative two-component system response regulator